MSVCVCVWECCVYVGSQRKMYFLLRYHQDNLKTTALKVVMLCPVDQGAIQGLVRGEMKTEEWGMCLLERADQKRTTRH